MKKEWLFLFYSSSAGNSSKVGYIFTQILISLFPPIIFSAIRYQHAMSVFECKGRPLQKANKGRLLRIASAKQARGWQSERIARPTCKL